MEPNHKLVLLRYLADQRLAWHMLDICNEESSIVHLVALNSDGRSPHCTSTIIVRFMVHTHECLAICIYTDESIRAKCIGIVKVINISTIGIRILLSMSLVDPSAQDRNLP